MSPIRTFITRPVFTGMLTLVQSGDRFALKWWIGRQVFTGTGQLAGRMLVVNWGDKHPVVYGFSDGRVLDGEWEPLGTIRPGG